VLFTNSKSHGVSLVPKSMTLNDLDGALTADPRCLYGSWATCC